jgi:hypothetical protein
MSHGESHYAAKLKAVDVEMIRELADERRVLLDKAKAISNAALAEKFDVSKSAIESVINFRRWKRGV